MQQLSSMYIKSCVNMWREFTVKMPGMEHYYVHTYYILNSILHRYNYNPLLCTYTYILLPSFWIWRSAIWLLYNYVYLVYTRSFGGQILHKIPQKYLWLANCGRLLVSHCMCDSWSVIGAVWYWQLIESLSTEAPINWVRVCRDNWVCEWINDVFEG